MYEVSWHFVHLFTSYIRLSGATFAFVLYHHDHTRPWKRWPNWTNYDSNWLLTHRILQTWPPATIIFPNLKQWLQRKRFTSNEEVITETEAYFVLQKGHRNVEKSLYHVYRPRRELCWGINITLLKKRLFSLKILGLFSPCSNKAIYFDGFL